LLSGGDITKRDTIIWGFTPDDSKPFLDYKLRDELFREAVLAFLVPSKEQRKGSLEDEYCKVCKKAKPNADCSTCDRTSISVIQKGKE